jgi:hypothetical protein
MCTTSTCERDHWYVVEVMPLALPYAGPDRDAAIGALLASTSTAGGRAVWSPTTASPAAIASKRESVEIDVLRVLREREGEGPGQWGRTTGSGVAPRG